jgi:ankyrin repeat protein
VSDDPSEPNALPDEERGMITAQDVLKRYVEEALPEFLELELNDVNQRGRFENCPLHVASVRGDLEEVAALLAAGADVNSIGELNNCPIHEAILQGHPSVVALLIQAGADLDVVNDFGDSPRSLAKKVANPDILRLIEAAM